MSLLFDRRTDRDRWIDTTSVFLYSSETLEVSVGFVGTLIEFASHRFRRCSLELMCAARSTRLDLPEERSPRDGTEPPLIIPGLSVEERSAADQGRGVVRAVVVLFQLKSCPSPSYKRSSLHVRFDVKLLCSEQH